jgi:plasmid stabilization system protein ParE
MAEVIVTSPAEGEYADNLRWYLARSVRAAEQFEAEFDRSIQLIEAEPSRYPRCDDRHRYFLMRKFPFQVIYRHENDHVIVISVAHTSREPRFWADR